MSLEFKGLSYQYIELDPYKKPEALLAINPRGLVPALKHGDWGCYESTVLMEYVRTLRNLFPPGIIFWGEIPRGGNQPPWPPPQQRKMSWFVVDFD